MKRHAMGVRVAAATIAAATLLGAGNAGAVDACAQTGTSSGGTTYTSDGTGKESGDGNHELWHDGGGTMKMTVYGKNAAFKAEWNNAGDFLARTGLYWGSGNTYSSYGNVGADFKFTKTGSDGGTYSYIGIYGWTKSPLVEYYIVENSLNSYYPPNASALGGATSKGSFTVDDGTYDIYTYQRVNKPSITGTATFMQFWSVRRTARTCGHISISEHWKKWVSLGMQMGSMYEAKLLVEAGGGQGTFDLSYGTVGTNLSVGVSSEPEISRGQAAWNAGKKGALSLVSLDGRVMRTIEQGEGATAAMTTAGIPKGMYLLRFQGEGAAPQTRKFLVD